MKNTLVVNLIGSQGTGKSTLMANVFTWLNYIDTIDIIKPVYNFKAR